MADLLDVGLGTIKRYEKDASKIPVSLVSKMAHLCDVDEVWLLTGKGISESNQNTGSEESSSNLTKITIEHQDLVKRFQVPDKAKEFNEYLINIEKNDPKGYEELFQKAKTIHQTINRLKSQDEPKKSAGELRRKQANGD
jgi:transcriptional regulator with XRE-family HTH domain